MQTFYDGIAREYVKRDEGMRNYFHNALELALLRDLTFEGKRLLDVGSGVGRMARFVRNQPEVIVGVDLSYQMLRVARKRIGNDARAAFIQCDAEFLPFSANSFDLVTCLGLFEYVGDIQPYLKEFFRVTAANGHLLFTCHNKDSFQRLHNRFYSTVDHHGDEVGRLVRSSGYTLLRQATAYHMNGRWIWRLSRILEPLGGESAVVRCAVKINRAMQSSVLFRRHGKVHLVLARRP